MELSFNAHNEIKGSRIISYLLEVTSLFLHLLLLFNFVYIFVQRMQWRQKKIEDYQLVCFLIHVPSDVCRNRVLLNMTQRKEIIICFIKLCVELMPSC